MNSQDIDEALVEELCAAGVHSFEYRGLQQPTDDLSALHLELMFSPVLTSSRPEDIPEQCLTSNELCLAIKSRVAALLSTKYAVGEFRTRFSAGRESLTPSYTHSDAMYVSEDCKNFSVTLIVTTN